MTGAEFSCWVNYEYQRDEYSPGEERSIEITGVTNDEGYASMCLMWEIWWEEPEPEPEPGTGFSTDELAQQGTYVVIIGDSGVTEQVVGWPRYSFVDQELYFEREPPGYTMLSNTDPIYSIHYSEQASFTAAIDEDGNGVHDLVELQLAQKFCPSLVLHSGDQGVCPEPVDIMKVDMTNANNYMYTTLWDVNGEFVQEHPRTNQQWYTLGLHTSNSYFPPNNGLFYPDGNYASFNGCIYGSFDPPQLAVGWYKVVIHPDFGGPTCDTPTEWYNFYNQIKDNYPHTIYPHLFQNGNETVIQYWFFYPFNAFVNRHEGDWEHINVVLNSQNPSAANITRVEYFFHHRVLERYPPNEFHIVGESHPVVFIGGYGELYIPLEGTWTGNGSHGSYPTFGYWTDTGARGVDENVDGLGLYLKYDVFNLHLLPNRSGIDYNQHPEMSWFNAKISWGQLLISHSAGNYFLYDFTMIPPIGIFRFVYEIFDDIPNDAGNVAPKGPAHNDGWNDVGASPDGHSFKLYNENPPVMNSWSPPQ